MTRKPESSITIKPLSNDEQPEHEFRYCDYALEDYAVLLIFWALCLDVFLQFFSRYALGDSVGWTEEMARYLLIAVTFLGSSMAIRRNTHISVEFFYQYFPNWLKKVALCLVDVGRLLFLGVLAWLSYEMAGRTPSMMTSVDLPKSIVYYAVCTGFVLMFLRSCQLILRKRPQRFDNCGDSIEKILD